MQIPRWRNVIVLRNSLLQSLSTSSIRTDFAPFHSTATTCEKWKSKWNADVRKALQPSKNHARYAIRQKRADTKKALKDFIFKSGSSKFPILGDDAIWKTGASQAGKSDGFGKRVGTKSSVRHAGKYNQKTKGKFKRDKFYDDFEEQPEMVYEARFRNRTYSWSFRWQETSFRSTTSGFEWRTHTEQKNSRTKQQDSSDSDSEYDDEPCAAGSSSDRTILGLPPTGALKIEDVKKAFHVSALKWHPDKHQGPSQEMAEEKFKLCSNAYQSLCNTLSA